MTRLLIVDDDTQLRDSLTRDLAAQGYQVTSVGSVDEAIALVSQPEQPVDVLLTDLRMPSRDGFDLLEVVRVKSPHTRSVLISAFASARDYDAALDRGAVAVVSKPFSRAEVHAAVLLAIECGKGMHGSLHGVSLLDVLQLYHLGHRSVEVHLSGAVAGMIVLEQGEIIHAECGALSGREALQQLLHDDEGSIRTRPRTRDLPRTLNEPFQRLVLDSLRTSDEENREQQEIDLEAWGALEPQGASEAVLDTSELAALAEVAGSSPRPAAAQVPAAKKNPPPLNSVFAALAERWRLACSDWGSLPAGAAVFCLGIAARRAVEESAAGVAEQTLALYAEALAVAGNPPTGMLQLIVGQLGFLLFWDRAHDALLVLVQDVSARNAPAYFRARGAFLAGRVAGIFGGSAPAVSQA